MCREASSESEYFQPLSGLCQLPADILLHVITFAASTNNVHPEGLPELIETNNEARFSPDYEIVTLVASTSVCRYWRHLFLETPSLWRSFSAELHPELLKLFLQRSKSSPLHVEVSDGEYIKSKRTTKDSRNSHVLCEPRTERCLSNTESILAEFHRIHFLFIKSSLASTLNSGRPSPRFLRIICSAFETCPKSSSTILQGIAIDSFWPLPSTGQPRSDFTDLVLSRSAWNFSNLRQVHLRLTYVPWNFLQSTSQSLTRLSMSIVLSNQNMLEGLETVLKKHTALDFLALDIEPDYSDESPRPRRCTDAEQILLPSLTKLHLTGYDNENSAVLGMLKLPSLRSICITDRSRLPVSDEDDIRILHQISKLELPFADCLCITFAGPYARFDLKRKRGHDEVAFTYVYAVQDLPSTPTTCIRSSSDILLSQLQHLNLSNVKHLDVQSSTHLDANFVDRLKQLLTNIDSVVVSYGDGSHPGHLNLSMTRSTLGGSPTCPR
ncbi:hypothetical protein SCHPADRAFT_939594 [Schizopora paradoxa]|uniref:Uncharacterized protein n=1 Tax=Schizopora paradoxa TaxID=27342 RepID=A0A0H2RS73_9AGAM|nr:hypothetical protein SCHPADRAFT_939594 [Schizopora paradoxa]